MKNFEIVIELRNSSHRSWKNLKNAALKLMNLPCHFNTAKVESSSLSVLRRAIGASGMSAAEILAEIERRGLA